MSSHQLMEYDKRNVVDHYKYWRREAINSALDCKRHDFSVAIEHWTRDLNIGSCIRNANAFLAREVHYIGVRNYDRRGAVGTHNYVHMKHHRSTEEFIEYARSMNYTIIAFDNIEGAKPIENFKFPRLSMLVFGEEATGITQDMRRNADELIYIKQYGSVRSLNAGVASGIAMYEWTKQHG